MKLFFQGILKRRVHSAAFIITALFLYLPVMKPGVFLYGLDTIFHDYILLLFGWGWIRQGTLVQWNPYIYSGIPFIGSFSFCPFYPPSWLFLFPAFPVMFNLQYVLHNILAGAFMYRFLRGFRLNRFAALFGGLGFQVSGHLVTLCYPGHLQKYQAIVWLPLAWHFLDRALTTGKRKFILFSAGALAMPLLSSHPQIYYYSVGVLFLYALWLIGNRRRSPLNLPPGRVLSLFLLAVFFSLSIAAIQILPGYETAQHSVRGGGLDFQDAAISSYPPGELWELILPRYTGDSVRGGYGDYWGAWGERLVSDYLGMAVFILALLGSIFSKRPVKLFFSLVILLSILIACGAHSPVFRFTFRIIPGMNRFRSPATIMFLIPFSACVLAAFGVERVLQKSGKMGKIFEPGQNLRVFLALFAFLLIVTIFVHIYHIRVSSRLLEYKTAGALSAPFYARLSLVSLSLRRSAFFAAVVFGSLALLVWTRLHGESGNLPPVAINVSQAVFLILFVFDAGLNNRAFIQPEPVKDFHHYLYNAWPVLRLKNEPQPVRLLDVGNELSNRYLINRIGVPLGYHPIEQRDYLDAWNAAGPGRLAAARLTACAYIAAHQNVPMDPDWEVIERHPQMNKVLYKWKNAVPYAYVPEALVSASDQTALLKNMTRDDFDPHKTSYVLFPASFSWKRAETPDSPEIRVIKYETDLVVLDLDLPEDSYVITGDVWAPGWKALIEDGRELPIFPANNAFRCFKAPEGRHTVTLYYRPQSFIYGAIISIIALALWLGLVFYFSDSPDSRGAKLNCA